MDELIAFRDPEALPPQRITETEFHERPLYWLDRDYQVIVTDAFEKVKMVIGVGDVKFDIKQN